MQWLQVTSTKLHQIFKKHTIQASHVNTFLQWTDLRTLSFLDKVLLIKTLFTNFLIKIHTFDLMNYP